MRRLALALVALTITALPARAADLPPEVDHMLWCSSAFYWLSADAQDAGAAAEADRYDKWSTSLAEQAAAGLKGLGYSEEQIGELADTYDNEVVTELTGTTRRYDPAGCAAFIADQ